MAKENKETKNEGKLLVVIRISGMVRTKAEILQTLERMRLRRKYAAMLMNSDDINMKGMLKKARYHVAYGEINEKMLLELIKKRAELDSKNKNYEKFKKGKIDAESVCEGLIKGKSLKDFGLKNFFRLHPPRKGIKSKLQYPKGVLGNNKEDINKLLERML